MKNSTSNKEVFRVHRFACILLFLFLNAVLLFSCSGYKALPVQKATAPVSWFQFDTGHYLFNAGIDLMKNHFSGLIVVKPTKEETHRVIMITETGLKIFDFEFFPDRSFKVHYIMEAMDRKLLIKTLSRDISLVLMNGLKKVKPQVQLVDDQNGNIVFQYGRAGRKVLYLQKDNDPFPYRAIQKGGYARKASAYFWGSSDNGPDSVKIEHTHIALSIGLIRIIENSHVNK